MFFDLGVQHGIGWLSPIITEEIAQICEADTKKEYRAVLVLPSSAREEELQDAVRVLRKEARLSVFQDSFRWRSLHGKTTGS